MRLVGGPSQTHRPNCGSKAHGPVLNLSSPHPEESSRSAPEPSRSDPEPSQGDRKPSQPHPEPSPRRPGRIRPGRGPGEAHRRRPTKWRRRGPARQSSARPTPIPSAVRSSRTCIHPIIRSAPAPPSSGPLRREGRPSLHPTGRAGSQRNRGRLRILSARRTARRVFSPRPVPLRLPLWAKAPFQPPPTRPTPPAPPAAPRRPTAKPAPAAATTPRIRLAKGGTLKDRAVRKARRPPPSTAGTNRDDRHRPKDDHSPRLRNEAHRRKDGRSRNSRNMRNMRNMRRPRGRRPCPGDRRPRSGHVREPLGEDDGKPRRNRCGRAWCQVVVRR